MDLGHGMRPECPSGMEVRGLNTEGTLYSKSMPLQTAQGQGKDTEFRFCGWGHNAKLSCVCRHSTPGAEVLILAAGVRLFLLRQSSLLERYCRVSRVCSVRLLVPLLYASGPRVWETHFKQGLGHGGRGVDRVPWKSPPLAMMAVRRGP